LTDILVGGSYVPVRLQPGTYPVMITAIHTRGRAGEDLISKFGKPQARIEVTTLDGQTLTMWVNLVLAERSKLTRVYVAATGSALPSVGTKIDLEKSLIGRRLNAIVTDRAREYLGHEETFSVIVDVLPYLPAQRPGETPVQPSSPTLPSSLSSSSSSPQSKPQELKCPIPGCTLTASTPSELVAHLQTHG
jgi:hypothetical protein